MAIAQPHRDFDVEPASAAPEGPSFTLAGVQFRCLPAIPAMAMMKLPRPGDRTYNDIWQFLHFVLVPEDEEKFDEVLASKERPVDQEKLVEIFQWLLTDDGGGLTPFARARQQPSLNGSASTAPTSKAASRSKAAGSKS